MNIWTISGFNGINNMQEPSSLKEPAGTQEGGLGPCELVECINYDIDDSGGLVLRDAEQVIFTKAYDAKLTQRLQSRLFTASGNRLYYTEAFMDVQNPRANSIGYLDPIVLIQEIGTGMWVSTTTQLYFHSGANPAKPGGFNQVAKYNYPAIAGTGEKVSATKLGLEGTGYVAVFATTRGICIGDASGGLTNISEGIFSYVPGQRGISYIKEANGMIQYQVKMINDVGDSYNKQEGRPLDIDEI